MVTGKEGTVSTASLYCRYHVQRLQEQGNNASGFSESFGLDPRAHACPTGMRDLRLALSLWRKL